MIEVGEMMKMKTKSESDNNVFDLGAFVGDLGFEDDASCSDDILSLEGLEQELEECKHDDVVANILSKGTKLRDHTKGVENNLRQVELDSIQAEIGSISSNIKILLEKSMDMGLRLKNRKAAKSKLGKFVEDIIVPS